MRNPDDCDLCRNGVAKTPEAVRAYLGEWDVKRKPLDHLGALVAHLEKHLGSYDLALAGGGPNSCPTDVLVFDPRPGRPFTALVSSGVSRLRMSMPPDVDREHGRIEFAMLLPPQWNVTRSSLRSPKWSWPIDLLLDLARYVHEAGNWLWCRHTYEVGDGPLVPGSRFRALLLHHSAVLGDGFSEFDLPHGGDVHMLSLWPLHRDELRYALEVGCDELVGKLLEAGVTDILDPARRSIFSAGPVR